MRLQVGANEKSEDSSLTGAIENYGMWGTVYNASVNVNRDNSREKVVRKNLLLKTISIRMQIMNREISDCQWLGVPTAV